MSRFLPVIPAQAGIQWWAYRLRWREELDSRLRGNDDALECLA